VREVDGEEPGRFLAPYLRELRGAGEEGLIFRAQVGREQATLLQLAGGCERCGDERGVDVIGVTPAAQTALAIPPVADRYPTLQSDEVRGIGLRTSSD